MASGIPEHHYEMQNEKVDQPTERWKGPLSEVRLRAL